MAISWVYVALAIALVLSCLVMVGLKLFGVIDLSWLWVFAPIYVPGAAVVCLILVAMGDVARNGWH